MQTDYDHSRPIRSGILLVNLGTPEAPTAAAVRRYLAQFLSDRRVVELSPVLWKPILHGIVLRFRPARVARLYRSIWMDGGSPLLVHSRAIADALSEALSLPVELGMSYGSPSLGQAWERLRAQNVQRLLVLPLYPQYSATTTAAAADGLAQVFASERLLPETRWIRSYHDHPGYIEALAESVRTHWARQGQNDVLVMSFHGIPQRCLLAGDPYFCHCHKTGRLLAEALGLGEHQYRISFQSRFGREQWLKPYTDEVLQALGAQGQSVDVVCPGFPADCLETLEEIAIQNQELFQAAGGGGYAYIPALNDSSANIAQLAELARQHLQGWEADAPEQRQARAIKQGAEA